MHSKRDHHFIAILIQNMKFINATLIITYFISTLIYNCDIHDEIWNDKPARQILSITKKWAQWRNSNNFLFFGFKKKIQKIRGHCCVLFVILYLPSSFFERHARWNLNLSSKFTIWKKKKKKKKEKKIAETKYIWTTNDYDNHCLHVQNFNATFVSRSTSRSWSRNSKNS